MKRLYLIIIILTLTTLNKSYGSCLALKIDTGKRFWISGGNYNPLYLKIGRSNIAKTGTVQLRQQSTTLLYNHLTDIRKDSDFANAKLIRTGWDGGIFDTMPSFYRHDLARTVPAGFVALSVADRERFILSVNQDDI